MTAISSGDAASRSLSRHSLLGSASVLAFIGGLSFWAAVTPLSGAVVAGGSIVVDSGIQRIQHQGGGIVEQILVHNGTEVAAGDTLIQLDETEIGAELAAVNAQLAEAYIKRAGLLAESELSASLEWPGAIEALPNLDHYNALFEAEERLRATRAAAFTSQLGQLGEQVTQLRDQVEGLEGQLAAIDDQIDIISEQSASFEELLAQRLVESDRVIQLRSQAAQLQGERARVLTEIARGRAAIAEKQLQISQTGEAFQADAMAQLREISRQISEFEQRQIAARDRLDRLVVTAPIAGIVHDLQIETIGGVIQSGETLMQIVPQDDLGHADVRISPLDIDKLKHDQPVTLRFPSFSSRDMPELLGTVERISPDLLRDPVDGAQFYIVRVDLPDAEIERLPVGERLVPGMPVEAFFMTGERTVLDYIFKPVVDQLSLAFRED